MIKKNLNTMKRNETISWLIQAKVHLTFWTFHHRFTITVQHTTHSPIFHKLRPMLKPIYSAVNCWQWSSFFIWKFRCNFKFFGDLFGARSTRFSCIDVEAHNDLLRFSQNYQIDIPSIPFFKRLAMIHEFTIVISIRWKKFSNTIS